MSIYFIFYIKEKRVQQKKELLRKQQETLYDNQPSNKRRKMNISKNEDPFLIHDDTNNHRTANDWMVCIIFPLY